MAYKDLREYISRLEAAGQLRRVKAPVSAELEITEIADRTVKSGGPALLFENVRDSGYPLLIGAFGSYERMALALGEEKLDAAREGLAELIDLSRYVGIKQALKSLPGLSRFLSVFPLRLPRGACQEVVEEPDLGRLPILKCWPGDAGRFITLPLVFTRDPETGRQNLGMYRMQVYDRKTTGMHWHLHKDGNEIFEKYRARGERMPVSVAIGCDPATIYAATAPLPNTVDELFLRASCAGGPYRLSSASQTIYSFRPTASLFWRAMWTRRNCGRRARSATTPAFIPSGRRTRSSTSKK